MTLDHWFVAPEMLAVGLVAPVFWMASRARQRSRAIRLAELVGPRAPALAGEASARRRRVARALVVGGVLLLAVAAAQPTWGYEPRRIERGGIDVLVCLDVSRSMLAQDVPPSRLGRAQAEIRALAQRVRGDRLGLVAFAGEARLTVPLTRDAASFSHLVDQTDPLAVRRGGTDLGAALETALATLTRNPGSPGAIVLITDGEDHEQRGLLAARRCAARGVTVHCVGFGSVRGSKIAIGDEAAGEAFLTDRSGAEVVTAMDAASLRAIAAATGGGFLDAGVSPRPLLELYAAHVRPAARRSSAADEHRERKNRFQWPLLAAFVLLWLELSQGDRRRRPAPAVSAPAPRGRSTRAAATIRSPT